MNQKIFPLILGIAVFSIAFLGLGISAQKKTNSPVTNLHDFMEDYTKPALKHFKRTGDRKFLNQLVPVFPELTIDEQKEDWKKIVDKAMSEGKPENSCKSCHKIYKKKYKKVFRKREITIPESILGLDEEIKKAGK